MTFMERDFVADIKEKVYGSYIYCTELFLQYRATVFDINMDRRIRLG